MPTASAIPKGIVSLKKIFLLALLHGIPNFENPREIYYSKKKQFLNDLAPARKWKKEKNRRTLIYTNNTLA